MVEELLKKAIEERKKDEIIVLSYIKDRVDKILNNFSKDNKFYEYPNIEKISILNEKYKLFTEDAELFRTALNIFPSNEDDIFFWVENWCAVNKFNEYDNPMNNNRVGFYYIPNDRTENVISYVKNILFDVGEEDIEKVIRHYTLK